MKKIMIIVIALLVSLLILSFYEGINLRIENSRLKNSLMEEKMNSDDFYGQIQELSFIIEHACPGVNKFEIHRAISLFTDIRRQELKNDSIDFIQMPPLNPAKVDLLYGYHSDLKFHFYKDGKIKNVEYKKYKPTYRKIN